MRGERYFIAVVARHSPPCGDRTSTNTICDLSLPTIECTKHSIWCLHWLQHSIFILIIPPFIYVLCVAWDMTCPYSTVHSYNIISSSIVNNLSCPLVHMNPLKISFGITQSSLTQRNWFNWDPYSKHIQMWCTKKIKIEKTDYYFILLRRTHLPGSASF